MVALTPATYVVAKDLHDLEMIKQYCDLDDVVLVESPQMLEGLIFFEGDRIVVGFVDREDERLDVMHRGLVRRGHWLTPMPFTDVVLGKPKVMESTYRKVV